MSESESIAGCCRKRGAGCDKHAHNVRVHELVRIMKWKTSKIGAQKKISRAHLSLENCTIFVVDDDKNCNYTIAYPFHTLAASSRSGKQKATTKVPNNSIICTCIMSSDNKIL